MTHAIRGRGRAVAAAVLSLSALSVAPTAAATFTHRTVVTIDHTRVPDADLLPLGNFPVLVSLTHDNLKTTGNGGFVTSSQGHDILFQGEDAPTCGGASPCRLDHEIESYDGTTGTIVAWVRVPGTIFDASDGSNTPIYMYYGDATITCSQENKKGVWDASYREVFHLNEEDVQTDSTQNAFTAAGRGAVTGGAGGKVGPAVDLASTATGLVPAHLNVSDGTLPTGTSFTLEAWVNLRTINAGQYIGLVTKGRECLNFDGDPDPGVGFCTSAPCGDWTGLYKLQDGSGNQVLSFEWAYGTTCKAAGLQDPRLAAANLATGTWYHVAGSFDFATSTRRLLVNGTQVATDTLGACIEAAIPQYTRLGTDSNADYLDGQLDEVRISFAARPNDWIGTGYNNQNAPYVGAGGFYSSIAHQPGPYAGVGATACPARNPCAGGPGTCYLRSIGNTAVYAVGSGTCTATNGSSVVTCPGAGWQSANRGRGDRITIEGTHYMVLAVDSETQLRLSTPFTGAGGVGNVTYAMSRQFATLQAWEDCISGGGACPYFAVGGSGNLVAGNRSEIGVVYKDSVYTGAGILLEIEGSVTDTARTITLTADGPNRHHGVSGAGVVVDNAANLTRALVIGDQHVTVEWLEVRNGGGSGAHCIDYVPSNAANQSAIRNNLVRNCAGQGIRVTGSSTVFRADITNNIVYRGAREGIAVDSPLGTGTGSLVRILNNTLFRNSGSTEISTAERPNPYVVLRNNIVVDDTEAPDLTWNSAALCTSATNCDWWNAASGNNITGDPAPPTGQWQPDLGPNPRGTGLPATAEASLSFVNTTASTENLHIQSGSAAWNRGADLTGPVNGDIDAAIRTAPWDIGADELPAASAPPLIAYSDSSPPEPALRPLRFTALQGASWSAPGQVAVAGPFPTTGDWPLFNKVARTSADGLRRGVVFAEAHGSDRNPLYGTFWDGATWTNGAGAAGASYLGQTGDVTALTSRHFDAAFEQSSGDLLAVTGINADESVDIYLHSGAAWSGNLRFTPAGNGVMTNQSEVGSMVFRWVRLEPRPGTNRIAFIGLAHDTPTLTSGVVHAAIWNGDTNSFGSKTILSLPVTNGQNANLGDAVDIDYVLGGTNAGEALAVWGNQTTLRRAICSAAGTWGGGAIVQDLGVTNTVRWLRQKAASNSDNMVLAIEDVNERIYTIRYDGDTRTFASFTAVPHSTTAFGNADQNRPFDVAWDLGSGANSVLLVYSDTAGIRYRTSSDGGAAWSGEQTLTVANQARWVQLERDPSNVVHLVVMDQANDLRAWKWTAGAFTLTTTPSLPSTDVERNGASLNVEGFALATWPPLGSATTAVKLMSFAAVPGDGSVVLEWRTGSELDNLGFHVHRGPSADGPWTRLTGSLIPGLGSSPLGQSYSWLDSGLVNGQRYYYRLEDVDTASVSTFHGPVSAVPSGAGSPPPPEGGGGSGSGGTTSQGACPSWVVAAYRQAAPAAESTALDCAAYGRPESVSLREVARDARSATLELRTGGFYAVREPAGTVRVFAPGFDFASGPTAPALPVRRALVEAAVGKKARLASVEALELRGFPRLRPSAVGAAEMAVGADGTVRPARRGAAAPRLSKGYLPQRVAWLAGTVFQGDTKSAVVELSPVRFDGYRQQLVLAERVRVRVVFSGRDGEEAGAGTVGRRVPRRATPFRDVLARLHTSRRGLHAVGFEDLFPARQRGMSVSVLRLQRQGQPVPFHVEPDATSFGPGSRLYFHADEAAPSGAFSSEVAWELVRSSEGRRMAVAPAAPAGGPIGSTPTAVARFEANRVYQPGLLDAPDLWLWDSVVSGAVRVLPFTLAGVDASSPRLAELVVHLQGGSDAVEAPQDHHVRVSVNGIDVGDTLFDGKRAQALRVEVPASLLREGPNEIALVNVGDTGVSSLVFLDRFTVSYPQQPAARGGAFEGAWPQAGAAEVAGLAGPPVVVDLGGSGTSGPTWLAGWVAAPGGVRFRAEAGRRYVVATRDGLLAPRVERALPSTLRDAANQADYLVIGPRDFLDKAAPLLERRASQGLNALAVAFEEIAEVFGHGQPSAEAIRDFLAFAYHSWSRPSPRYVVLLGDSSYDPRHFQAASLSAPLPALWAKTSYLWTVADPLLAAVNGDDALPDLAIGRLPAATPEEAETLVSKMLAWEDSGQGLSGAAALVADNPDAGGDFEADIADIASGPLAGRSPQVLRIGELGVSTRPAIQAALDSGLSLMSYVGHGGAAVWASENVWNSWDAASLQAQSRQPLLLTLNCLNGYFVAPSFDALSESMLKAEGRGAIAAVSPSGLSLDGPAHAYHRALLAEIAGGSHERLGDAVLAAQQAYAQTGLMPELLAVYQLLGDPALSIR